MATEDSIERIAADVLIATLQQISASRARDLLEKPELLADAYKKVHKAVEESKEASDY